MVRGRINYRPHLENNMNREIKITFGSPTEYKDCGIRMFDMPCNVSCIIPVDYVTVVTKRCIPRKQILENIRAILDIELQKEIELKD